MAPGANMLESSAGLRSSPFLTPQDSKIIPAGAVSGGPLSLSSAFERQIRKFGWSFGVCAAATVSAAMSGGCAAGWAAPTATGTLVAVPSDFEPHEASAKNASADEARIAAARASFLGKLGSAL